MALFSLEAALANYARDRARLTGPHPSVGCSCPLCDIVRAADLLYQTARAERRPRWRLAGQPPGPDNRRRN